MNLFLSVSLSHTHTHTHTHNVHAHTHITLQECKNLIKITLPLNTVLLLWDSFSRTCCF